MLQIFVLLLMTYVGLLVGASKGDLLNPAALGTVFAGERPTRKSAKVLDTSVIIDGRIADIAEAGFIDGMMVVPEFVLRELQVVADSTDGSKRQRGRRGLDMLQRMQSNPNIQVQIVPDDFPSIREVDLKLLELAKKWEAKVVTNDFNLNKVAHLHRVEVLNINDLANALKPVVLPGEQHECAHPERRQGVQPGRRLPGRRHHGGGGSRAQDDRPERSISPSPACCRRPAAR